MSAQIFIVRRGDAQRRRNAANALLELPETDDWEIKISKHRRKRSIEQNKLQRKWMLELEAQGDMTAEEYRGYCKLHFGVPIMRNEDEEFRRAYDRYIRDLPYEHKLAMMMVPLDFPVTRGMSTKQKTVYLDSVYRHFTGEGFVLTVPVR